jgi:hypothetical protein
MPACAGVFRVVPDFLDARLNDMARLAGACTGALWSFRMIPTDRSPDRPERPNGRRGQCREAKQSGASCPATDGAAEPVSVQRRWYELPREGPTRRA